MTLEEIRTVFENLSSCTAWSLLLLQIKNSKTKGTTYSTREVVLSPEGALTSFVKEISDTYCNRSRKSVLSSYEKVIEYDGSAVGKRIYSLYKTNTLIADEYVRLVSSIADPNQETDPLDFRSQASILNGSIIIDGEDMPIKLFSMQRPVTLLKHKFLRASGTFKEIDQKVITLRTSVDVAIIGETVYMFTLAGEKLFNMERAYNVTCFGKLKDINNCNIVSDFDAFSSFAKSGHNPRKFVSFNDEYLLKLKNSKFRSKISKKFGIPLDGDLFDTSKPNASDGIVKLLCGRGMVEPFDESPMEVAGSKQWEK